MFLTNEFKSLLAEAAGQAKDCPSEIISSLHSALACAHARDSKSPWNIIQIGEGTIVWKSGSRCQLILMNQSELVAAMNDLEVYVASRSTVTDAVDFDRDIDTRS